MSAFSTTDAIACSSDERCPVNRRHPVEGKEEGRVTVSITEIYQSSSGDRWQLVRTTEPTSALVRHIPNSPSGGRPSDITVAEFLSTGVGPEHWALRRILEGSANDTTDA